MVDPRIPAAPAAVQALSEAVFEARVVRSLAALLSRNLPEGPDLPRLRISALCRRGRLSAEEVFEAICEGELFEHPATLDDLAAAGEEMRKLRDALTELAGELPAGGTAIAALDEVSGFIAEQMGVVMRRLTKLAAPWTDRDRRKGGKSITDAALGAAGITL